ncbi:MAG: DUF3761 domain-containing protein [Dokdonella sp.]
MKALFASMLLGAGFLMAVGAQAQVPPDAPAGTTATCKDGSYFAGATKKGACRGHKGVKEWYGASAAAAGSAAAPAATPARESKRDKTAAAHAAAAAAPAAAPAGSTGLCKDGSYYSGATKKGACRGHKGVKEWYGATEATAATAGAAAAMPSKSSPAMPMTPPAAATPAAPAATPTHNHAPHAMPANPSTITAAPGGGNGQVWVNEESKVYHCQSDRYYGKTKKGEYMSEADALAKGNHAARGKACSAK